MEKYSEHQIELLSCLCYTATDLEGWNGRGIEEAREEEDICTHMAWQSTPMYLLGECHGQRSLEGPSAQSSKVSDKTKAN